MRRRRAGRIVSTQACAYCNRSNQAIARHDAKVLPPSMPKPGRPEKSRSDASTIIEIYMYLGAIVPLCPRRAPALEVACELRTTGVLSVAKLSPRQEAYYAQSVAGGLEDYYAGRGEA